MKFRIWGNKRGEAASQRKGTISSSETEIFVLRSKGGS